MSTGEKYPRVSLSSVNLPLFESINDSLPLPPSTTSVPDGKALMATGPWALSNGTCDAICARPLLAQPRTKKAIEQGTILLTVAVMAVVFGKASGSHRHF